MFHTQITLSPIEPASHVISTPIANLLHRIVLYSQSNSNSCYLNNFFLIIQSIGLLLLVIRGVVFCPFLKEG